MKRQRGWWMMGLLAVTAFAAGLWMGYPRAAMAAGGAGQVQFQLMGVNPSSSLLVYEPGTKTVYVYQGATTGNADINCSYKFELGTPGEPIRRIPCPLPTMR
ncbi:MAG TPA: hypothetical protein VFI20_04530 [Terracidiphilus sp.]|nr:hypothetical protein [Terracidiphilus sp.]